MSHFEFAVAQVVRYCVGPGYTPRAVITHRGRRRDNGQPYYTIQVYNESGMKLRAKTVSSRWLRSVS